MRKNSILFSMRSANKERVRLMKQRREGKNLLAYEKTLFTGTFFY
jgi:hypothetical protein